MAKLAPKSDYLSSANDTTARELASTRQPLTTGMPRAQQGRMPEQSTLLG
jgi:hypothetical protein